MNMLSSKEKENALNEIRILGKFFCLFSCCKNILFLFYFLFSQLIKLHCKIEILLNIRIHFLIQTQIAFF